MPLPFEFDFRAPDYFKAFEWRVKRLDWLRKNPDALPALRKVYREDPAQFIIDWGVTFDPRNVERGLPTLMPFLLFDRQEEWVHWCVDAWRNGKPGLTEKSRDMGVSWLMVALAVSLCLFNDGVVVGFGSRKEDCVDKRGDPGSLLHKVRTFLEHIPKEFKGDWHERLHSAHMRVEFPLTKSLIKGEAGTQIGRGDRTSLYFIDESAFLDKPQLVEASLSATTNCRMDVSTHHGPSTWFCQKIMERRIPVFEFDWTEDPRKDQEWYEDKKNYLDPIIFAQEVERNPFASVDGILIPVEWAKAAIDAHITLKITPNGMRRVGVDVADQGSDANAFCGRYGILVECLESWSGKSGDIYATVERVFTLCDAYDYFEVLYDADGLGVGVRGDARKVNEDRKRRNAPQVGFTAFRGSGAVQNPDAAIHIHSSFESDARKGFTNIDYFANAKAQGWWSLRDRFRTTYQAVVEGADFDPEDVISISSAIPNYQQLVTELSQPTYRQNDNGKFIIDKMPGNMKSPNLADSLMIAFAPNQQPRKGFFHAY